MSDGSGRDVGTLTRRSFVAGASVLVTGGVLAGRARALARPRQLSPARRPVELRPARPRLPVEQHAWGHTLPRDPEGNPIPPRFDRLLFFDIRGRPTADHARLLEARLRELEHRFEWSPAGLLFTVSWGPRYFTHVLGIRSPIPRPTRLSSFERPRFDEHHLCLHLAADDQRRLVEVERALVHGHRLPGVGHSLSLASILHLRETRTGFTGAGLPAAHQRVRGIPRDRPVPGDAPLYMGFRSSLRRNQATESEVTIGSGPFRRGTTMQVSYMRLHLERWYGGFSEQDRVARMYSPQTTVADVSAITNDAPGDPHEIVAAIRRDGMIGHAQATAQARRHGRPLILRRDFNTADEGYAGVHFVSVQRSIDDFVVTRNAMNAPGAHLLNRRITDTRNNGINEFIEVRRRGNYIVPSRAERSFPLLPGRMSGLR